MTGSSVALRNCYSPLIPAHLSFQVALTNYCSEGIFAAFPIVIHDKGKPSVRVGRKAMGPLPQGCGSPGYRMEWSHDRRRKPALPAALRKIPFLGWRSAA